MKVEDAGEPRGVRRVMSAAAAGAAPLFGRCDACGGELERFDA